MNVILPSVVLIFCASLPHCFGAYNFQNTWKIIKFRAVTSFNELHHYYRSVKQTILDHTARPQEAADHQKQKYVKKNICKNIFSSPYFRRFSEHWVNTDLDAVRDKLKHGNRTTYESIFRTTHTGKTSADEYVNPYEYKRTAYIDADGGVLYENVFLCVVSESATGVGSHVYSEYYVSGEYNVNVVRGAYPIVGRFVFYMDGLQELRLQALAEESAISHEFIRKIKVTELFYLWKRNAVITVADPELDPVCSLSDVDKVRLCSILLGAPLFERSGQTFVPQITDIVNCQKRRVKIRIPVFAPVLRVATRPILNPHRNNEEWVMGCRTSGQRSKTYYIARGPQYNSVFAFKESRNNQELTLFGYFDNVSVVGDSNTVYESQQTGARSYRGDSSLGRTPGWASIPLNYGHHTE